MQWLNLNVELLSAPEFILAEPVDRATWLCLLVYCVRQENGGVIEGCAEWKSRTWEQICAVTKEEISRKSLLWEWEENDLRVWGYPSDKEREVRAMRRGGRKGGLKSGAKRSAQVLAAEANNNEKMIEWGVEGGLQAGVQGGVEAGVEGGVDKGVEGSSEGWLEGGLERKGREGKGREYTHTHREESGGEAAGKDGGDGGGLGVVPSEAEVLSAGAAWPGDMARGIPAGIPEAWVLMWYDWMTRQGAPAWPADWQGAMRRRFVSDWISGHPKARGQQQAGGAGLAKAGTPNVVTERLALESRRKALEALIEEHAGNRPEAPLAARQELRALKKEREEVIRQLAGK